MTLEDDVDGSDVRDIEAEAARVPDADDAATSSAAPDSVRLSVEPP